MKEKDLRLYRRGFTLIELLVVIGILGILLAALIPMVSGSRDSAMTAKCKNNMKNLALAVITCAQANDSGHFPVAGYCRSLNITTDKSKRYIARRSWISNTGASVTDLNDPKPNPDLYTVAHFTEQGDEVLTAVTNGAIWFAAGSAFEVYRCPIHVREYEKSNDGRPPWWSYMMNQEFGYNRDGQGCIPFFGSSINGMITVSTESSGKRDKKSASRGHDKVLLFAEVQGIEVNDSRHGITLKPVSAGDQTDAVLEYTKEDMGFNHVVGKKRHGGNVAFADGHVDTVLMPTEGAYIRNLTRYLCQGFDVPHDGSRYTPTSVDE